MTKDSCHTVCGDGLVAGNETCDDGNSVDSDGCSSVCSPEISFTCSIPLCGKSVCSKASGSEVCGDGYRTGVEIIAPNFCDDGNVLSGDGCSSICKVECGYACQMGEPTTRKDGSTTIFEKDVCQTECGDGIRAGLEECDSQEGCESCFVQIGWSCSAEACSPSICTDLCGDGVSMGLNSEQTSYCDDGNIESNDGCSDSCSVECGYTCDGGNSSSRDYCLATECGDGVPAGSEQCDDNNTDSNDGCSSICTVEQAFFKCVGNPCDASLCMLPVCGDG